jgi:hypothetical protein
MVALYPFQNNFGEIDHFIDKLVMRGDHAIVQTLWADDQPDSLGKMSEVVPLYINGWDKTDEEVEMDDKYIENKI